MRVAFNGFSNWVNKNKFLPFPGLSLDEQRIFFLSAAQVSNPILKFLCIKEFILK